jgi:3-hydroxyacyl-CoA dehydrogenase
VNVLVIGAGLMGSQIGCEYAIGGHSVVFAARDPRSVTERVEAALALADRLGRLISEPVAEVRSRIEIGGDAPGCELVIESLPEDLALKADMLRPVAERAPSAVIATNTSSLSITAFGAAIGAPERTIGTHYWNPPLLMPLVEVIAGARTVPAVIEQACTTSGTPHCSSPQRVYAVFRERTAAAISPGPGRVASSRSLWYGIG